MKKKFASQNSISWHNVAKCPPSAKTPWTLTLENTLERSSVVVELVEHKENTVKYVAVCKYKGVRSSLLVLLFSNRSSD